MRLRNDLILEWKKAVVIEPKKIFTLNFYEIFGRMKPKYLFLEQLIEIR